MAITASQTIGNGCSIDIGSAATDVGVLSATFTENGNPIDVTVTTSAQHDYLNGIPDLELTFELLGDDTWMALGAVTGASVDINLSDGTTAVGNIANGLVTNVERSASIDGQFVTSLTIKPERQ